METRANHPSDARSADGGGGSRSPRWTRALAAAALVAVAVAACGARGSAEPDGGAVDADPPARDASADPCAEAHAAIGPEGGTLTLCDATLSVAPGQLPETIDFAIERVDDPPPLRAPFVIVGHAWRFSPERFADTGLVRIAIAHDDDRPLELVRADDGVWETYGACEQTGSALTQTVWPELGTFAAITDGRDLPRSPTGIGSGTSDLVLGGVAARLATGEEGYLTDEDALSGLRTFAFHAVEGTVTLSTEIGLHPDGVVQPMFVLVEDASTGERWQMDTFSNPDAIEAHAAYDGASLDATLEGTLFGAAGERAVSIALSGTPGPWWREPPRFCVAE